jgi:uncharacterized protein involved in exopolysaccharide biosynthesis
MKIQQSAKQEVSLWPVLLPCLAAGIAALLLSSAGCGSAASAAETTPNSAIGKVAQRAVKGKPSYTATAYLLVQPQNAGFAPIETRPKEGEDLAKYAESQATLLKSRPVIEAALKAPEIAKLKLGDRTADPTEWLGERLQTSTSQARRKKDIIEVSVTCDNPAEAAALANALANAYLSDVIGAEMRRKRARYDQLERAMEEPLEKIRRSRSQLKPLVEKLGTTDPHAIALKVQVAAEQLSALARQSAQQEFELRKAKSELESSRALWESLAKTEIPEAAVDKLASTDSTMADMLLPRLAHVTKSLSQERAKDSPDAKTVADLEQQLRKLQSQVAARREELREQLRQRKGAPIQAELKSREAKVHCVQAACKTFVDEVAKKRAQLEQIEKSAEQLAAMRPIIDQLEGELKGLVDERERLLSEINRSPRVTLAQRAETPIKAD